MADAASASLPFTAPPRGRARGLALLLAGTVLIAVMDMLVKVMSDTYSTAQLTWARYVAQTVLLVVLATPRGAFARMRTNRLDLHLLRAGLLVVSSFAFFASLRALPLTEANAIGFAAPLLITAMSAPILAEKVTLRQWVAVVAGFAGVLLVIRPGSGVFGWAAFLPLLSACCAALYHVLTRVVGRSEDPANTLYYLGIVGAVSLSGVVPFFWVTPDLIGVAAMVAIGALGTVGLFLLARAFQAAPAASLSPFFYVYLVWATGLGWLVFGDVPSLWTACGSAVILASGLYVYRDRGTSADVNASLRGKHVE
jgi:drug/metabolite transporter (DMT)-like permease